MRAPVFRAVAVMCLASSRNACATSPRHAMAQWYTPQHRAVDAVLLPEFIADRAEIES